DEEDGRDQEEQAPDREEREGAGGADHPAHGGARDPVHPSRRTPAPASTRRRNRAHRLLRRSGRSVSSIIDTGKFGAAIAIPRKSPVAGALLASWLRRVLRAEPTMLLACNTPAPAPRAAVHGETCLRGDA